MPESFGNKIESRIKLNVASLTTYITKTNNKNITTLNLESTHCYKFANLHLIIIYIKMTFKFKNKYSSLKKNIYVKFFSSSN